MYDHVMSEWRYEPKPGGFSPLGEVGALAVHWIGGGSTPTSLSGIIDRIRAVYVGHISGEYNDIAYNAAVDQNGETWELRGMQYQGGATFGNNDTTKAILFVGGDQPASRAAIQRIAQFRNQAIASGQLQRGCPIKGHRDYVSTECPGNWLYSQLPLMNELAAGVTPVNRKDADSMDAWTSDGTTVFGRFGGIYRPISGPEWERAKQDGIPGIKHSADEFKTMRLWGRFA